MFLFDSNFSFLNPRKLVILVDFNLILDGLCYWYSRVNSHGNTAAIRRVIEHVFYKRVELIAPITVIARVWWNFSQNIGKASKLAHFFPWWHIANVSETWHLKGHKLSLTWRLAWSQTWTLPTWTLPLIGLVKAISLFWLKLVHDLALLCQFIYSVCSFNCIIIWGCQVVFWGQFHLLLFILSFS